MSVSGAAATLRVEGVGKRYRIGRREPRGALRAALTAAAEPFWALQDVSFAVGRGEVVGIVGRNGAGKSTLLKILARVTAPTAGRAEIRGRVASLLEVGTGFHPELTGRENIFLNGAILGMKRAEIRRKFGEIVAFAEVERFIDTPVKRYSSGMYMRLAFAVAAHLEPEILIVDEVLAVGDAAFQRKCLGKMGDVARHGRTILFVSHNMNAIQRLCNRCLLLEAGRLIADGDTPDVVARYLAAGADTAAPRTWVDLARANRNGTGEARFVALRYTSPDATVAFRPYPDGPLEVGLMIASDAPRAVGSLAVTLYDQHATKLVNADTLALGRAIALRAGENIVRLRIECLHLNPGIYTLGLWLAYAGGALLDHVESALQLEVVERQAPGLGNRPGDDGRVTCRFSLLETEWDTEDASGATPGTARQGVEARRQ